MDANSIYAGLTDDDVIVGEAVALDLPAASFGLRFASGAIDMIVGYVVIIAGVIFSFAISSDEALARSGMVVSLALGMVIVPTALETLTRGRSLGKLAMGLRTVRVDGGPISFRHALVRAVLGVAEIYLFFGVPALITAMLNSKGKRLGDLVAGTYVVRNRYSLSPHGVVEVPAALLTWVASADIAPLPDSLAVSLRQLSGRRNQVSPQAWAALIADLAARTRAYVAPPPPAGTPDEAFLAAVTATRRQRDEQRLAREAKLRETLGGRVVRHSRVGE